MALHKPFGENLARFEPAAGAIRAEDGDAGLAQPIADAGSDRRLGTQNRKLDLMIEAVLHQPAAVRRRDVPVFTARCRAGITGCGEYRIARR